MSQTDKERSVDMRRPVVRMHGGETLGAKTLPVSLSLSLFLENNFDGVD